MEPEPPSISVPGVARPITLRSGATMLQLKYLAAAFKLCPSPTHEQVVAIATRVGVSVLKLTEWFQTRNTLQAWLSEQPQLQPTDIASMFFDDDQ